MSTTVTVPVNADPFAEVSRLIDLFDALRADADLLWATGCYAESTRVDACARLVRSMAFQALDDLWPAVVDAQVASDAVAGEL